MRGLIQRAIEPDAVVDLLVTALALPLDTVRNCDGLLGQVIEAALAHDPGSKLKPRNVTVKLLTRIIRDLRCAAVPAGISGSSHDPGVLHLRSGLHRGIHPR